MTWWTRLPKQVRYAIIAVAVVACLSLLLSGLK
jgi:hypothetical protein